MFYVIVVPVNSRFLDRLNNAWHRVTIMIAAAQECVLLLL